VPDRYFKELEDGLAVALKVAGEARSKGFDPTSSPEIPVARDLAERVEKLLEIPGLADRLRELDKTGREEAALQIALEISQGKIGGFQDRETALDKAVRAAVAVLTEGVVAAPIEGIAKIELAPNDDGSEFIRIYYSGPIRSAGGTAQALSVLAADYVRHNLGIERYKPRPEEIERYAEEIDLYRRTANLQYQPSEEEVKLIVENCPICIDGEATEDAEVDGHRDLERVPTNRVRGGMALVIAEGIALKAPKLRKHVEKLKIDGWEWLSHFNVTKGEEEDKLAPKDKYLRDLIAGRPVFSYPSRPGGFRLRYGRGRNTGFAAAGISPATMVLMDNFIAPGTQLKVERPGKAAAMAPVDIEGPTVRLINGDVLRIDNEEQAKTLKKNIQAILDAGEILINYGDFLENNHPLPPGGFTHEWWLLEAKETLKPKKINNEILEKYRETTPTPQEALALSKKWKIPLHPEYTYLWHDITPLEYHRLREYITKNGNLEADVLRLPLKPEIKETLEKLLLPHRVRNNRILIQNPEILLHCLALQGDLTEKPLEKKKSLEKKRGETEKEGGASENALELANLACGFPVFPRAPTRIGARMGRPEKSNKREMKPAPHVLFPLGEAGGRTRSLQGAKDYTSSMQSKTGRIPVQIGIRQCPQCKKETFKFKCQTCGKATTQVYHCIHCKLTTPRDKCPRCGKPTNPFQDTKIDLKEEYHRALENLGERDIYQVKGVIGLTSKNKTPEPLEKGILRAKHGIVTFKDGTIRYDLSDLPLTHFRPQEIKAPIEKLKKLGYTHDIHGNPLERPDQILELKVQDIIVSQDCGEYLLKTANFIDDLLTRYYKLKPYYQAEKPEDLIGKLAIGLAPHTSAGVLARIIGFTSASVGYAHPYFHAAKRRNCDGDEDCVMLLLDGLLNFSRAFLPDKRGGTMDAPLVLTTRINPREIDKEVHNMDVNTCYPLEFYRAAQQYADPKGLVEVMDLVSRRLGTLSQYQGFGFTVDSGDIAAGPQNSAYKTLGSMIEKMDAQLNLARKLRAVDAEDVAERVINSHFLPDLIGNLRSFSKQQVRCTKCNRKYRRPPLQGKCKCGGNLVLTVHKASVSKYLEVSKRVAEEYHVKNYTRQRIELIDLELRSLFENEKARQMGLADFM